MKRTQIRALRPLRFTFRDAQRRLVIRRLFVTGTSTAVRQSSDYAQISRYRGVPSNQPHDRIKRFPVFTKTERFVIFSIDTLSIVAITEITCEISHGVPNDVIKELCLISLFSMSLYVYRPYSCFLLLLPHRC
jgi:hypothetical protein